MLTKILPFIIFLCVAFVVCSNPGVVANNEACKYDGPLVLNDLSGTITSPLHSSQPPTTVACSWLINNTNSDVVIISFGRFDLGEDIVCSKKERDCCSHQWLQLEIPDSFNENHVKKHQANKPNEDRLLDNENYAFPSNDSHAESDINLLSNVTIPYDEVHKSALSKFILTRSKKAKKRRMRKNLFNVHHHDKGFRSNTKKFGHLCGNVVPQPIVTTAATVIIKFYSDENINPDLGFVLHYQITNNVTVCTLGEFACSSPHLCIPESWRCNGQAECPDGLDEENCLGCAGITENDRCDGLWHCQKGQDELGCFDCSADEWSCEGENNECYKKSQRCDGTKDCRNGVDEAYCTCGRNQSRCSPNSAYCYDPVRQRCDGVLVCPGGEDEMDCGHCGGQGGLIGVHMIACSNGEECYSTHQRCDGVSECRDGSDEHNCSPQLCHPKHGSFLCANRHCIRDTWRCDQFDDCGDASDEDDCLRNSVIVAAAMGGLVCSLLLVIAVGCTCRLYALRLGLTNRTQNQRGGRRSTQLAPLTRLEQHLLQREPPPSYSVAVNDPSASLFGGAMCLGGGWRRQRRGHVGGLGSLASDGQALVLPVPSTSGDTHEEISGNLVANSNEEKEIDEGKVLALGTASRQIRVESQSDDEDDNDDDDVPLLSAHTDDDDYSDDDLIVATNDTNILILSNDEQLPGIASTSSLEHHPMPGSSHSRGQGSLSNRGQGSHIRGQGSHSRDHDTNAKHTSRERILINLDTNEDNHSEINAAASNPSYDYESSDTSSSLSSSMTDIDTHAAVLALTVVSHYTDQIIAEAATHTEPTTQHTEPTTQHTEPSTQHTEPSTQHALHHEGNI